MNARTHIQLLKKVAVNERDMFEWHYLLEGPDGFSLFIYMHMHMYITYLTPISHSYLLLYLYAHTTVISFHYLSSINVSF